MSRIFLLLGSLVILIALIFFVLFFRKPAVKPGPSSIPQASPSATSLSPSQQVFHVTGTDPANNAQNTTPGETMISFSTDVPLVSKDSFSLTFSPSLPHGFLITNTFPSQKITLAILGGLQPGTTYQVSITNSQGQAVYSWSFTTSQNATGLSSSALQTQIEQNFINQYYPLLNFTPYSTADFDVDYTARSTLTVKVKNPDVNKVKQEVIIWIQSHNVDPSTQTINYVNSF